MINSNKRFFVINILMAVMLIMLVIRLFNLQITDGNKYKEISGNKNSVNLLEKAPRGEIYDRYGKPLVVNRECYSVTLIKTPITTDELNTVIYKLINVIENAEAEITDTFPINENGSDFTFDDDTERQKWFDNNSKKVNSSMTAAEVFRIFAEETYKISSSYSINDRRKIAGIRYEAELRGFSALSPYTVIEDANVNIVAAIKERQNEFPGVAITNNYVREYNNGMLASHILGRTGKMNAEEYEAYKEKGYSYNDIVGKQGIEKAAEQYLRGEDGIKGSEYNIDGERLTLIKKKETSPGANVILTIDSSLQETAEKSLERNIKAIKANGTFKRGIDADAGAAVVIDVKNGDVLALCSYPTYNLSEFNEQYSQLVNDEAKPMWNRAVSGTYAPGSTFKPLTAIAALESGAITPEEKITDEGVYRFYKEYQPKCWIWQEYRTTHGSINVSKAIEHSCNYFFYETGRRLGIEKIDEYASEFGLGEYTGIELPEETTGYIAGPEAKKKMVTNLTEQGWFGGDTLQAAIGQSYNLYTPVQLANYVAIIANGGTRYKVSLIKSIRSGTDRREIISSEPQVISKIDMKPQTLEAVKLGMKNVVDEGSASAIFNDYPIKIGGKTGTAQIGSKQSNNALFVAFAPFDDPEIAVCVVLEHGVRGANAAYVARDIFDDYFNLKNDD